MGGIADVVLLAGSEEDDDRKFAANAFRQLSEIESNRAKIVHEGGVEALLGLAQNTDPAIVEDAAKALATISSSDSLRAHLVSQRNVSLIVTLIHSEHDKIVDSALQTLSNISHHAAARRSVLSPLVLPQLCMVCNSQGFSQTSQLAVLSIFETLTSRGSIGMREDIFRAVSHAIELPNLTVQVAAVRLAVMWADMGEETQRSLNASGVLRSLLLVLDTPSGDLLNEIVTCLLLFAHHDEYKAEIPNLALGFDTFLAFVLTPVDRRCRLQILRLLSLLSEDESECPNLLEADCLGTFRAIEKPSVPVWTEIVKVLINIAKSAERCVVRMVEENVLDILVPMLRCDSLEIRVSSVEVLTALCVPLSAKDKVLSHPEVLTQLSLMLTTRNNRKSRQLAAASLAHLAVTINNRSVLMQKGIISTILKAVDLADHVVKAHLCRLIQNLAGSVKFHSQLIQTLPLLSRCLNSDDVECQIQGCAAVANLAVTASNREKLQTSVLPVIESLKRTTNVALNRQVKRALNNVSFSSHSQTSPKSTTSLPSPNRHLRSEKRVGSSPMSQQHHHRKATSSSRTRRVEADPEFSAISENGDPGFGVGGMPSETHHHHRSTHPSHSPIRVSSAHRATSTAHSLPSCEAGKGVARQETDRHRDHPSDFPGLGPSVTSIHAELATLAQYVSQTIIPDYESQRDVRKKLVTLQKKLKALAAKTAPHSEPKDVS